MRHACLNCGVFAVETVDELCEICLDEMNDAEVEEMLHDGVVMEQAITQELITDVVGKELE